MGIPTGGRGANARGEGGNTNRQNQLYALNDDDLSKTNITEVGDVDMESSNKRNEFYNGTTPWSRPQNADESIFHAPAKQVEAPLVRNFTGTLEIGFSI
jgi:hypothetical protein